MSDRISVTGNIATPPDYKRTPSGVAITNFRLATTERRFDRATGAWVDGARNFYNISTFRHLAEHAFASLKKGDRVVLTGRLYVRNWDAGEKHGTSIDIEAESIGHDLLFGTTTFHPAARAAAPSGPTTEPDSAWRTAAEADDSVGDHVPDAWNVPGGSLGNQNGSEVHGDEAHLALTSAAESVPF